MSVSNDSAVKIDVTPAPPALGTDGGAGIQWWWKREDLLDRGLLGLRVVALIFSLISFILVASNLHGDRQEFYKYQEYRYLLAVAILSSLYTGGQVCRQVFELSTGNNLLLPGIAALIDFVGDQIAAYLLISSASTAIPITNTMREGADDIFTDSSAAAITTSFFAFLCLALSALLSGYKLSAKTYI